MQTQKDMELMGCKQVWNSKGPGKFFHSYTLLPAKAEAGKLSGRRTQAAGLCHWGYLITSPVLQIVLTSKHPFTDPASFHVHADICSHTILNYKSDQNSHLLLALGSSDHEHVKFYIVEICNFIASCAG